MDDADKFDKLKKKRSALRRLTSTLINKVLESIGSAHEIDLDDLKESYDVLAERKTNLQVLDDEIQNMMEADAIDDDTNSSEEYQEKCTRTATKINRILKSNNYYSVEETRNERQGGASMQTQNNYSKSLKLPKLILDKYGGDPKRFTEFWNSYESTIEDNDNLSKIEKFAYLKSLLTNQAYNIVSGFELTSDNYDRCIKALKERYGRKEIIIQSFMNKILNLEAVKNSSNVKAMRKLYDELEVSVRNLEAMNVASGSYGHLLIPILLKLIPEDMVLDFNRQNRDKDEIEVNALIEFIKSEIECREQSNFSSHDKISSGLPRFEQNKNENKRYSKFTPTAAFNTNVENRSCVFCPNLSNHDSFGCRKNVNEKLSKLKDELRCFICFKPHKGLSRNCWQRKPCKKCHKLHHFSICDFNNSRNRTGRNYERDQTASDNTPPSGNNESIPEQNNVDNQNLNATTSIAQCHSGMINGNMINGNNVLLQTCVVKASSDNESKLTRIMLDQGSMRSFIQKSLVEQLKLKPIRYESLGVYSFGIKTAKIRKYPVVQLLLENRIDKKHKLRIECLVSDIICASPIEEPCGEIKSLLKTSNYQIADDSRGEPIQLLIGAEYFWNIIFDERKQINDKLLIINSMFGWLVTGYNIDSSKCVSQHMSVMGNVESTNDFDLKQFWEIESLGLLNANEASNSYSDKEIDVMTRFEQGLKFKNGRYETGLLFKDERCRVASNFEVAKKRFISLGNKLSRNMEIFEQYKDIVSDQLKMGIVEQCLDENVNLGYYMPHKAVIRPSKTTSMRLVYDISSKNEGCHSLNDALEIGPNLNPNVLDVMLKFRKYQVAFSGDLEKAFLQISITPDDRDYLRFIWFGDNQSFKLMRMTRLPFGMATSPFILAATIKHHIKKYEKENSECFHMLNTCMYVDDSYYGHNNIEDAYRLSTDAVNIFKDAGFNMRKLETNSSELNSLWIKNGFKEAQDLACETKILGMTWRPMDDTLKLNINTHEQYNTVTKRQILQSVARIYDPIGFINPFVVRIKILLQKLWLLGVNWDDPLPCDILNTWNGIIFEIPEFNDFSIPRKLFVDKNNSSESIHIFSDASLAAYGSSCYLRYKDTNNDWKTTFILSKSRISPLRGNLTLPKLELMGALVGARLGSYLAKVFPEFKENIFFWCDSQITLAWIKAPARNWKPFVCNRVSEIQAISCPEQWRHVSGKDNPADLVTRGESANKLLTSSLWWNGPSWLVQTECSWPANTLDSSSSDSIAAERRVNPVNTLHLSVSSEVQLGSTPLLFDLKKFSSLKKVHRITAWILRFINNAKPNLSKISGPLGATEISSAQTHWIKTIQHRHYMEEVSALSKGKELDKASAVRSTNPVLDGQGLLRLKGRLQFSDVSENEKHPWLLPSKDKYTELVVRDAHEKVLHAGVDATLAQVREQFWIVKGRQTIKTVLRECNICKKYSVRPGAEEMAPLPPDRILEAPPFSVTGLDFAGPLFTKDTEDKHYILLFTCAVTRSLHIELVNSMSTENFILAFRKFISRRGLCNTIYSDNAKSFKKADKEISKIWKCISHPAVKNMYANYGIVWKYSVEKGAWWGGFWERQVKTIKTSLKKIIGRTTLSVNELETVLMEIEAMINSRPITYIYDSPSEPSPLTPAHFLIGKRLLSLPATKVSAEDLSGSRSSAIKRYKHQQQVLNHFWRRWRKSYLLCLRSANMCPPLKTSSQFKLNDIVLIHDDKYPRNIWKLGKVIEVIKSRDGLIRSCMVKTEKGAIKRPIQLLYNLEINN